MQHKWARIIAGTIVLGLVAMACGDSESTTTAIDSGRSYTVVYEVTGSQPSAVVSYTSDGGSEVFRDTEALPFEETFEMKAGDLVDLGAVSVEGTSVTCRILVNQVPYRENTGSDGAIAVCQGTVTPGP